ncbi:MULTISPECIES: hypothetical protein [Sphingomonadaceae]|uniref:Uncharacterized protein n=1 Tax=Sphingomonas bisphenolicum TaxID=296544 RepID=A0ABM7G7N8_9SPHN|nr:MULTISPECIES: hypothetical protein [Sphingomonadaceae]WCP12319.1 hypothetical protein sphantq_00716 [Sphingobium sp. AntQ-1]BBF70909.1 hypothetical protein SBA_ch1_31090 [Sphingomonas bisphenolicum]
MIAKFIPVGTQTEAGRASVEEGLVLLDGPDGIAVTMTASAALETGKRLVEAAKLAGEESRQISRE